MEKVLRYGPTAKALHWTIVVLLLAQFAIGWIMPDVHKGPPGAPMTAHISLGITILLLIVVRLAWRLTHPVAPEASLPSWQRVSSEAVHWTLYIMVIATTLSGWFFASFRGWHVRFLGIFPMPMLDSGSELGVEALNGWHQISMWILLTLIGAHVVAALVHLFIYRDRVMQRMLPG